MPEIHSLNIEHFHCIMIRDGAFTRPSNTFFLNADEAILKEALEADGNTLEAVASYFHPLYIDTGKNRVLIDTGVGPSEDPSRGTLFKNMSLAGIQPENIDTVIITHQHGDHIGGNTNADGRPAFPNARYFISRVEWEHYTNHLAALGENAAFLRKNLIDLQDRLTLVDWDSEIVPGIVALNTIGHSHGHMALMISTKLLHIGDAFHQPRHFTFPDWSPKFDALPELTPGVRRRLIEKIAAENLLVFGFHMPETGFGRLVQSSRGWRWESVTHA